jgi:hypothetical protein
MPGPSCAIGTVPPDETEMSRCGATLSFMVSRISRRALSSYLLRIAEVRTERVALAYELIELRGGAVHRFGSVAALRRFLGEQYPMATVSARGKGARRK